MYIICIFFAFILLLLFYRKNEEIKAKRKREEREVYEKKLIRLKDLKEKMNYTGYEKLKKDLELFKNNCEFYKKSKIYFNNYKVVLLKQDFDMLKEELKKYENFQEILDDYNEIKNSINSISFFSDEEIKEINRIYVENELEDNVNFFSNVGGKSLDEQQRLAIVKDEDNNLVVAGAGSGKTLTITGKVKYLIEKKNILPEEILLITFTKAASNEMTERIKKNLKINIDAITFHKLGLKIISLFEDIKYEVLENLSTYINDKTIKKIILNDEELLRKFINYINYYVKDNISEVDERFENKSGYYYSIGRIETLKNRISVGLISYIYDFKAKYYLENKTNEGFNREYCYKLISSLPNFDFIKDTLDDIDDKYFIFYENEIHQIKLISEELKKKIENNDKFLDYIFKDNSHKKDRKTLYSFRVRSEEERIIANFLYLNGIKCEYEHTYLNGKYKEPKYAYRSVIGYKPDFYLPEYDIYIEHYGVDKDMKAHQYTSYENKKYEEAMKWKKAVHELNKTKLIETYSFQHNDGVLLDKLKEALTLNGVEFKPLKKEDMIFIMNVDDNTEDFKSFWQLVITFLTLFKSNNYKKEDLNEFKKRAKKLTSFMKEKHTLFFELFEPLYEYYNSKIEGKKIDFNDMINKATDWLNEAETEEVKRLSLRYKYIIIDEFQDSSIARFKLIKSLRKHLGDCKVLAVGDDWQSIYRFAGSDISIFTDFEKYFGKTEVSLIEKTYRNSQNLINVAQKFIMKNPKQILKNLKSDKQLKNPFSFFACSEDNMKEKVFEILKEIEKEYKNKKVHVTILARNNFNFSHLEGEKFQIINNEEKKKEIKTKYFNKNLILDIKTTHTSKGLEADEVIIIDVNDERTGFPNKIVDDSILSYVLSESDRFPFGEERRLFYVALTRTRNRCFILHNASRPSCFVNELKEIENRELNQESSIKCRKCGGNLVERKDKNNKRFYGCIHFPKCNYTQSID